MDLDLRSMVIEWIPEEASLLHDRPFSATASVYISIEAWETQTFSSISLLGTLGPGDTLYQTGACVIHTIYNCMCVIILI